MARVEHHKRYTDDKKVTDKVFDHNRKWPRMSSRGKEDHTEVVEILQVTTTTNTETNNTEMCLF